MFDSLPHGKNLGHWVIENGIDILQMALHGVKSGPITLKPRTKHKSGHTRLFISRSKRQRLNCEFTTKTFNFNYFRNFDKVLRNIDNFSDIE